MGVAAWPDLSSDTRVRLPGEQMSWRTAARFVCLLVLGGVWVAALASAGQGSGTSAAQNPGGVAALNSGRATYVGVARCAECHQDVHKTWASARHSKMLQPATPATVVGDFSRQGVTLRGARFALGRDGDRFSIGGPFPASRDEVHRVDYTLGSRRVQHYLTTLPDGRIVVLPPTWDVQRREWFHNLEIVNPDEAARNPVQVWNSNCVGCHVSGQEKGYDAARIRYDTRWIDFGTSCERCHGPGGAHADRYSPSRAADPGSSAIVVPTALEADRSTMICAQCHSLRDITFPGFVAGADYFDHFTPVLEYGQKSDSRDPAYWPDGRPRRFSNDAIGFWQSRCFLYGGATCVTCHLDPHEPDIDRNPQLARTNNALCAQCHGSIASDVARHSRHDAGSAGSSCIACHMPGTVVSLRARMPDHTIGVPAPENTVRHGIPNACSECHQDKDANWAVGVLQKWFPNGRRQQFVARADAFAAARHRDPGAIDLLIRIARDGRQPPLIRANAIGYLRFFPVANAQSALVEATTSEQSAVRATAVLGLGEPGFSSAAVTPILTRALSDPRRVVRVGAALSLMNLKITSLSGDAGRQFEQAKRDYLARAALLEDDASVLLDTGKFHLLNQDAEASARTLEASLRLDGGLHAARYFLAVARLAQGRANEARELLAKIPRSDPYGEAARTLLESPQTGFETLRIRGDILVEGGGPLQGAQIKTDAIRGATMSQFAAQREFRTRTGRNGDWSLLGVTRGLWILEITAPDHAPHVVVVPIYLMLRPEPIPWETSLALLPLSRVSPGTDPASPTRLILNAAEELAAGRTVAARESLLRLSEASLDAAALCAAGDLALLLRDPKLARRFFELAATADSKWYRPQLGIASASIMSFDFDAAMKAYAAARAATSNKKLERMLSATIKDLQQIREYK